MAWFLHHETKTYLVSSCLLHITQWCVVQGGSSSNPSFLEKSFPQEDFSTAQLVQSVNVMQSMQTCWGKFSSAFPLAATWLLASCGISLLLYFKILAKHFSWTKMGRDCYNDHPYAQFLAQKYNIKMERKAVHSFWSLFSSTRKELLWIWCLSFLPISLSIYCTCIYVEAVCTIVWHVLKKST